MMYRCCTYLPNLCLEIIDQCLGIMLGNFFELHENEIHCRFINLNIHLYLYYFYFWRFYSRERIWHHHLTRYYTHSRLHYWLWFVVAVKTVYHLNISYYIATTHHYTLRFVVSSATANVCWHWTVDMPIAPYFIFWRCEALRGQLQIITTKILCHKLTSSCLFGSVTDLPITCRLFLLCRVLVSNLTLSAKIFVKIKIWCSLILVPRS